MYVRLGKEWFAKPLILYRLEDVYLHIMCPRGMLMIYKGQGQWWYYL